MCSGILQRAKGRTMKEQVPLGYVENVFMSKKNSLTDLLWAKPRMCQKPWNTSDLRPVAHLDVCGWSDGLTAMISCFLVLKLTGSLHNILIRIRNTSLVPDEKLQCYRCSHSKSRICRKILLLLLLLLLLLIIIIIIIIKTTYGAYL